MIIIIPKNDTNQLSHMIGVIFIIFGPKKLPEIGKAAGQTLREFKKSTSELMNEEDKSTKDANEKRT